MIFDHQSLCRVISSAQLHMHGRATDGAILPTTLRVRLVTVAGIGGSSTGQWMRIIRRSTRPGIKG
jgi:hypothetical protein